MTGLAAVIDLQRGQLVLWVPVLLAIGIGLYFGLGFEPGAAHYAGLVAAMALCMAATWASGPALRIFPTACAVVLVGLVMAGARSHWVADPVLGFRYYGPIEGRIVAVDRSASDKIRLTLDQVVLSRMAPDRTPARVRVSLHGPVYFAPETGLRVMMTGHLSPPQGPVEPGGFDFQRHAWFQGLGALGYTRTPALVAGPAEPTPSLWVSRLRQRISAYVQGALPGRAGAFAAAVTTGDRSAMDRPTLEALRISNLAHLLAISGLHMGLLTGVVFAAVRFGFALVPRLALRWHTKKIAACAALLAGAFYYALSGGNIATERAFIMVSVMFVAVLCDRRAITLRAVAIAATLVLVLRPETLLSPGFQMSFAATTGLVAVFGGLRELGVSRIPKPLRPILALVISSAVAGFATAPVAAAHFNRFADYGLLANVLAVPMMGAIVMPGAVIAAVLSVVGQAWIGLTVMQVGITWILWVADWVSSLPGSATPVVAPGPAVLPVIALGALWIILWRGRWRWLGGGPVAAGLILWSVTERPPLLISETGGLMGVMTGEGRALTKAKGDGFTALAWLENDGDAATQEAAHTRLPKGQNSTVTLHLGPHQVVHLSGRNPEARLTGACDIAALVVMTKIIDDPPCPVINPKTLRKTGSLAVSVQGGDLLLTPAKGTANRLWRN